MNFTDGIQAHHHNGRSVWRPKEKKMKNKAQLVTLHENILVSQGTFQPILVNNQTKKLLLLNSFSSHKDIGACFQEILSKTYSVNLYISSPSSYRAGSTDIPDPLSPLLPIDTICTATYPLSRKLSKLDEPDMQDTAGEAEMNS